MQGKAPDSRTRAFCALLALVTLVATWLFVRSHAGSLYDDAYIYLRYAKHVLAGCGLRWNCSDAPVEGYTGPLHLALIVALGAVMTLPTAAALLGGLGVAAAIVLGAITVRVVTRSSLLAIAAALLLAADHQVLLNTVVGMETGLAMAAVSAIGWCALRTRGVVTPISLAILLRPEAALFGLTAILDEDAPRRRRALVGLAVFTAICTLLRWWIFSALAPNTIFAKAGGTSAHLRLGASYLIDCLQTFPALGLAPLSLLSPELRAAARALLVPMALWLLAFLYTGGDHFAYARLAAPLVPLATALAAIGAHALAARLWPLRANLVAACPLFILAAFMAWAHALDPQHGFDNVLRWQRVGEWLHAHHPGEKIAVVPIGAIGYYSDSPLIDLVGLTEPAIARAGRSIPPEELRRSWIGHERHNTEWVLAQKPALIVLTKWRATPWRDLAEARAGFWAEWLLLREVKEGRAPYEIYDAEIAVDRGAALHWLMLKRK